MSKQKEVFSLLSSLVGQGNILTVPKAFIDYTGSIEAGLFLSQLLYWSDRGKQPGGWIYKTDKEWHEEIRLSRYAIRKAREVLIKKGILETKVKKANCAPTVHYRIMVDKFLLSLQGMDCSKSDNPLCENEQSITEITNKEKKEKGKRELCAPLTIPLDYLAYWRVKEDSISNDIDIAIKYYMLEYRKRMGKEHPKLKPEQWERVTDSLGMAHDENLDEHIDLDADDLCRMIDQHFRTKYKAGCDYNILHFICEGIKLRRKYEAVE